LLVVLLRSKGFWLLLRWEEGKTCFVVFVSVERERQRESSGWELLDGELGLRKCTSIVAAVTCGTTNIISGRAGFFVFPEVL
jgi:hypothetical protein